jgi:copper chaperone CopZ
VNKVLQLTVTGMACDHCVKAITRAVQAVPGAGKASVDLASGRVRIEGSPDPQAVRAAVLEEGYGVAA